MNKSRKEYRKEYYEKNKDKIDAQVKEYYEKTFKIFSKWIEI